MSDNNATLEQGKETQAVQKGQEGFTHNFCFWPAWGPYITRLLFSQEGQPRTVPVRVAILTEKA